MTEKTIGKAAGIVWQHISNSEHGVTLASLKRLEGLRADEAVAAIGWLAREGKVRFDDTKRSCTVALLQQTCLV